MCEQPKEYIITDDQLKQIKELIFHEDEVKFEKLAWKIISRPHPAPAPRIRRVARSSTLDEQENNRERKVTTEV